MLAIAPALRDLASQAHVARDRVAWPSELDPQVFSGLLLTARAHNALHLALRQGKGGPGGLPLTAGELLSLRGFGAVSLKKLLLKLGEFLAAAVGPLKHGAHATRLDTSRAATPPGSEEARTHFASVVPALAALADRGWIRLETVVWPCGLDIRLIKKLRQSDVASARLLEMVQRNPKAFERQPITANDVLGVRGFQRRRLKRLVVDLADFLIAAASSYEDRLPSASDSIVPVKEESTDATARSSDQEQTHAPAEIGQRVSIERATSTKTVQPASERQDTSAAAWGRASTVLRPVLAMAAQFERVHTLGDILDPELRQLAALLRCDEELKTIQVRELLGSEPTPVERLVSEARKFLNSLKPTERQVVEHRLVRGDATLEAVGDRLGVTRERVRQLQVRLERRLNLEVGTVAGKIAAVMRPGLGPVCTPGEVDAALSPLIPPLDEETRRLARHAVRRGLNYTRVRSLCMDEEGHRAFTSLKRKALELADDAGLISKSDLWPHVPPALHRVWPRLRRAYGFEVIGRYWALRATQRARVKAALLALGEPAPASNIAERACVSERQAAAVLASLPSVVKADMIRWGIKDWIEEPYDGIAAEIIKRIQRDGGSTDTAALERELPEKFGVKAESVRMYLRTERFTVGNGRVSLADANRVPLRPLDEVISGRTRTGAPYWEFEVKSQHLKGYSVTGFPAELADYARCKPDSGIRLRLTKPQGCSPLSIRWPLASTTGPSLGYIGAPLRQLEAREGDRARVVFQGDHSLVLELSSTRASSSDDSQSAEDILEAMRRRRQVW